MLRAALKSVFARKVRLILTVVSIVLGVGFVAGTFVLTDTMNKAFDDLFETTATGSDVIVRSQQAFVPTAAGPGGGGGEEREPVPEDLLATVQAVDGVASASGDLQGYAQMKDPATGDPIGGVGPPTIGTNWTDTNPALVLREGAPPGPGEVVVDAGTATRFDLRVGQEVTILFSTADPEAFTISGTAGFGDADNLAGATLALFETPTAQRVLDKEGVFDSISVQGEDGVEPEVLRERIQPVLDTKVEAVTSSTVAEEQSDALKEGLAFFQTFLLVFAAIALFVGAFIIFNTFSIIVAQRSRELALLRAIGASRRQVLTSVVAEAVIVGLVASIVGIVFGIGIAAGLKALFSAIGIDLPGTATQLKPRTIAVGLLVGLVVTTVAAVVPARRAARVAPVEAMRESQDTEASLAGRRAVVGALVTAVGLAALLYGLFGSPSSAAWLIGAGAALVFIGVAILAPLASRPLAGAIGRPIRGVSLPARLGRENAMRNPRRTASTASALMIGLGLIVMVSILSASLRASVDKTLSETLRADLTLGTSSFTPFSQDVAERAREVGGVAVASSLRVTGFRVNGSDSFMAGVDPATIDQVAGLGATDGGIESLTRGEVLVLDQTLQENGWSIGDTVPSAFATIGEEPLTIGGTFTENGLVQGDYVVSLETYDRVTAISLDQTVYVKVEPGADIAQTQRAIEGVLEDFGNIQVQDQAAYREQQVTAVNQVLAIVSVMLFLAVIIALVGIANTLGLSIFERTRELGLLRAVGMGRTQVKRMIRWESVIIAILGALFGVVIGVFFGWALQQALAPEGVTEFELPVGLLVSFVIGAGLAGVLTAIFPARRAAKLNVLESISYE